MDYHSKTHPWMMGIYDVFVGDVSSFQRVDTIDWFEGTRVFSFTNEQGQKFFTPSNCSSYCGCCARVSCRDRSLLKATNHSKNLTSGLDFFLCRKSWEISFPKDLLSQKMIIPYITPIPRFKNVHVFYPKDFFKLSNKWSSKLQKPSVVPRRNLKTLPSLWLFFLLFVFLFFNMGVSSLKWWYPPFHTPMLCHCLVGKQTQ